MSAAAARRSRGFTLLEVLVTVVIFALLFTVLTAGWFQAMKAQASLAETAQQLQRQQLLAIALRQAMSELVPPRADRGVVFTGTRQGFVGESSASLAPGLGAAPVPVSLQIDGSAPELALRVEHPGQPGVRLPYRLSAAEFKYLDASGQAHDNWPPQSTMAGAATAAAPGLPALLQLTLQLEGQARPMTILVAPRQSTWQLPQPTSPFTVKTD